MTGTIGHGMDKVDSLGGSSFEKLAFYCVLHCAKENPFKMDLLCATWRKYYESFHFKPNLWCQIRCIFEFCFLLLWSSIFLEGDECFFHCFSLCLGTLPHYSLCNLLPKKSALFFLFNTSFKYLTTMPATCNRASFTSI